MAIYDTANALDRARVEKRFATLLQSGKVIEVTEFKPKRTSPQNRYLHLVLGLFAMEIGHSVEFVKQEYFKRLCKYKGVEIIEGHMMPDHVHILVSIPPKISVSSFMGYLKGKSAMMIFEYHANLKYKYGNRHFWADGYYVSTVGLNEATVRKYIQEQEKNDIAQDRLSVKEYEDPFGEDKENKKPNETKKDNDR